MVCKTLRITEIFYSLQGESRTTGYSTVFVRLTGCPLRCVWCDTEYAFHGGKKMDLVAIEEEVSRYKSRYVTVTGGEPLAQPNCIYLLRNLADQGYKVSLETSGSISLSRIDPRIVKVVDLKAPGSGEVARNCYDNIQYLDSKDQIKFVIADRTDYEWSVSKIIEYRLDQVVSDVLFSPVTNRMEPAVLAQWILDDHLNVRFQLQLHRIIWGDKAGV